MKVNEILLEFNNAALFKLYEDLEKLGVDVFVSRKGDILTISKIVVKKEQRSEGLGSKAMELITFFADDNGLTLALTPTNDFGGTVSRLKQFYKRFGFVENKGRTKNFDTQESMVRDPQ